MLPHTLPVVHRGLFVLALLLAGCSSAPGQTTGTTSGPSSPDGSPTVAADVVLTGGDDLHFSRRDVDASAGTVTIQLTCGPRVPHDFVIEGVADDEPIVACNPGRTETGEIELDPGAYTFYCSITGHRATMEGRLTVT